MPPRDPAFAARLEAFQRFKIKHPHLEAMDQLLSDAIAEHTSYHLLALYGPSGVGKSTVIHRIASRLRAEEPNPAFTPVVIVQASPEDVGSSARLDFYRQVLHALRGHVAIRDRIENLPLARMPRKKSVDPAEWLEVRDAVIYALEVAHVRAICVDEAQHLMHSDAVQRPGVQLDWLKSLTNRANLLYILVGNFSLYDFCHLNGQAARRMRDEHFARYHLTQQEECENFIGALKALLLQVPLQVDIPEMLQQWQWFFEWSIGCVGILSDWVVETVSSLCRAGKTTLTIEELTKHALKPDQRFRLETEARTGEFKIEQAKAKSEQELLQLLGKPQVLSSSPFPTPSAFGTQSPQPAAPRSRSSKRIERAVYRDPVGAREAEALPDKSLKCSFLGPIDVTIEQFQESGIWHVECQNCGARRDMKKVKDRQKFPSHPPRKTPPPKGEDRWVVREEEWKLVKD
jgi:tRNA A37 threonylcarbamoyladenosine biosynthesis protein TsaE